MTAVIETPTRLRLSLPNLPPRHYWEIEVKKSNVYLNLKVKLWWWPFKAGRFDSLQNEYFSHTGKLTQELLTKISDRAWAMRDDIDPAASVFKVFALVDFTNAPARIVKG